MNTHSVPTSERILDAAELLFEQYGFEATSTRQIAEAAQANSAAPNFHFTTKENLIKEVFRRRMQPLVQDRLALLQKVRNGVQKDSVGAIYDSFVDPLIELSRSSDKNKQAFLSLLSRNTLAPRKEFDDLLKTELADYVDAYVKALSSALPHLSAATVRIRFDLAMATIARAFHHSKDNATKEAKRFILAGLEAN